MKKLSTLAASALIAASLALPASGPASSHVSVSPAAGAVVHEAVDHVEQGTGFRGLWCTFMPC